MQQIACPYCGVPQPTAPRETAGSGADTLADLYREVARIRELAQVEQEHQRRIAALTREVDELRATVALLRGRAPIPAAGAQFRAAPRPSG